MNFKYYQRLITLTFCRLMMSCRLKSLLSQIRLLHLKNSFLLMILKNNYR